MQVRQEDYDLYIRAQLVISETRRRIEATRVTLAQVGRDNARILESLDEYRRDRWIRDQAPTRS